MANNTEDVELQRIVDSLLDFDEPDCSMVGGWGFNYEKAAKYIQQEANRQKAELLDRLEATARTADNCTGDTRVVKMVFIGNERKKLKEAE